MIDGPPSNRRWYRLTSDRFILGLLALQCLTQMKQLQDLRLGGRCHADKEPRVSEKIAKMLQQALPQCKINWFKS